ncbi:MAG: sugar nucleotide-binding protein [Nitrospirales bacterium]
MAGVCKKDGHANPDYRGERSARLRPPGRSCVARIAPDGPPCFDLTKPSCEEQVASARPDVVIHAAAYTDIDGAEQQPDLAMAVNAQGTEWVARGTSKANARLIYISTDYVFDGLKRTPYQECDLANPLNLYGKSKLEGER